MRRLTALAGAMRALPISRVRMNRDRAPPKSQRRLRVEARGRGWSGMVAVMVRYRASWHGGFGAKIDGEVRHAYGTRVSRLRLRGSAGAARAGSAETAHFTDPRSRKRRSRSGFTTS